MHRFEPADLYVFIKYTIIHIVYEIFSHTKDFRVVYLYVLVI